MMFPELLVSINEKDKVLEIGPGSSPFYRSDVLLEISLTEEELARQRGFTEPLVTNKEIVYFSGKEFPFKDKEFDYVICSHVLEHIEEEDIPFFISELTRVANKGYLEFPTPYYDYLYNFDVHKTFVFFDDEVIKYSSKDNFNLKQFKPLQYFFYRTLELGEESILLTYRGYFFQGFEWFNSINYQRVVDLNELAHMGKTIQNRPKSTRESLKVIKKELRYILRVKFNFKKLNILRVSNDNNR